MLWVFFWQSVLHLSEHSAFFDNFSLWQHRIQFTTWNLEERTHTHNRIEWGTNEHTYSEPPVFLFFSLFYCTAFSSALRQCFVAKFGWEHYVEWNNLCLNIKYCYLVAKTHTNRRRGQRRDWNEYEIGNESETLGSAVEAAVEVCASGTTAVLRACDFPVCLPRLKRCATVCVCVPLENLLKAAKILSTCLLLFGIN